MHGANDTAWRDIVFEIVGFLTRPTVVAYIDQGANAAGDRVGEEDDLSVEMAGRTSSRLDEAGLASEIAFLVGIQNANE